MSGYKIKPYQLKMAEKYNVKIKSSNKKNKKLDVYDNDNNLLASIGGVYPTGKFYNDYATYMETIGLTEAKKKRKAYLARHKSDPKTKTVKGKKIKTPSYFSDVILW